MEEILGDKYNILVNAMKEYHSIMHGNFINKLSLIDKTRDIIADLSSLYVSMSKEKFKKDLLENYYDEIKKYFIPRKDHPIINKKIIEYRQKEKFKELYLDNDKDTLDYLNNLVNQYDEIIDINIIRSMISNFILFNRFRLEKIIEEPDGFNDYIRYEKACKLINRLNNGYIKYNDLEVKEYLDIIKYENNKYVYDGLVFDNNLINKFHEYKKYLLIYKKLKKEIIFKIKKINVDKNIDYDILENLKNELPFNDEYFEFDIRKLEEFKFKDFIKIFTNRIDNMIYFNPIEPNSILNDETYCFLTNYMIKNGLLWYLFISDKLKNNLDYSSDYKEFILVTFDYISDVIKLMKKYKYNINFKNICNLSVLCMSADPESIAILGEEVISKISNNDDYTQYELSEIILRCKELVSKMSKRNKSTVPYINGRTTNYKYSMYDSLDENVLLAGINTDACFKVGGVDNDFLHYCCLDKNGFIIKITDIFGNFIGRAAGFRNGNCVFINQLRTIYDEGGDGYNGNYIHEMEEIINVFKKACEDIVITSQNNKDEKDKIEFVFVNKSYILRHSNIGFTVWNEIEEKIGEYPMDHHSLDWTYFKNDTKYLDEEYEGFETDYGSYSIICIVSSKKDKINPRDLKFKDVEPIYIRKRNQVIGTNNITKDIINKINKIRGIYSYLNKEKFEWISIPEGSIVFIGDNWYIVYNDHKLISYCLLDFDVDATIEYQGVLDNIIEQEIKNKLNEKENTKILVR